jgi:hypothetical protein
MDLNLYVRVIWRFRFLVFVGLLLAILLAFLAMAKVSFAGGSPKISYRENPVYSSSAVLLVTQRGFPEGRTVFPYSTTDVNGQAVPTTSFADPTRFSDLAVFYATLAQSDAVQRLMRSHGRVQGTMTASPVTTFSGSKTAILPLLSINGTASSAAAAQATAQAGTTAFINYLAGQQSTAGIAPSDRVVVQTVNRAEPGVVVTGRKKTIPVVVFLTVLIATLGLAFILENLRPRVRPVESLAEQAPESGVSQSA